MKQPYTRALVIVALALGLLVAGFVLLRNGRRYEVVTLIAKLDPHDPSARQAAAALRVRQLGTNIGPILLSELTLRTDYSLGLLGGTQRRRRNALLALMEQDVTLYMNQLERLTYSADSSQYRGAIEALSLCGDAGALFLVGEIPSRPGPKREWMMSCFSGMKVGKRPTDALLDRLHDS